MKFVQTGIPIPGKAEENLCLKAYQLLKQDFKLPSIQIHLHKNIPTGAGLGGGSSDASYMIRLLNELFNLGLSQQKMRDYAFALGSDCPFFIQDHPMMGSGRGEVLMPVNISLRGYFIVILTPGIHVSTKEAYDGVELGMKGHELGNAIQGPLTQWKDYICNDFEKKIFITNPVIKKLREDLYSQGAVYASMSGSGSSVFGIFDKKIKASEIFNENFGWAGEL